jgi:hypothetical protein
MKTRLLLSALAATVLVSGTAMAATATPAQKCTALISQWTDAGPTHKGHAKFALAEKFAASGEKMCKTNKEADGVKDLTKALTTIGVKPAA